MRLSESSWLASYRILRISLGSSLSSAANIEGSGRCAARPTGCRFRLPMRFSRAILSIGVSLCLAMLQSEFLGRTVYDFVPKTCGGLNDLVLGTRSDWTICSRSLFRLLKDSSCWLDKPVAAASSLTVLLSSTPTARHATRCASGPKARRTDNSSTAAGYDPGRVRRRGMSVDH